MLTLRKGSAREHLRRIVQAFVKDKRALQKSALVRAISGTVEEVVAVRDRAAKAPAITDFFTAFLSVTRNRDDIELNREALAAVNELVRQAPEGTWPKGKVQAIRAIRKILRDSPHISENVVFQAALVAAGRPDQQESIDELRKLGERVWRRRKLRGLEFAPDSNVFQVAQRRVIRTVERIQLSYPDELTGVRVVTDTLGDGSTKITILTEQIEVNEIDNEKLGELRRLVD